MEARHSVGIRNHLAYNPYRTSTTVLSRDEFYIHAVICGSFCLYLLLVGTIPWSCSEIIELGERLLMTGVLILMPHSHYNTTSKLPLSIHPITFFRPVDQLYNYSRYVMSLALIQQFRSAHRDKLLWRISCFPNTLTLLVGPCLI